MSKIGIIAGKGLLPLRIIEKCIEDNKEFEIFSPQNQIDSQQFENKQIHFFDLGQAQKLLDLLKAKQVNQLVFAGKITRPSLKSLNFDKKAKDFIVKNSLKVFGDEGLFQCLSQEFEREGFKVLAVSDFLDDFIVQKKGVLGDIQPNKDDWADINKGLKIAHKIGSLDIGQAVIIQSSLVLGVEALEGTDELIKRCSDLKREEKNGILIKAGKYKKEKRIDLPTIGLDTIKNLKEAKFHGIVLESKRAIIIDHKMVIDEANKSGIFIYIS